MNFNCKRDLISFLRNTNYIGQGSQGTCYQYGNTVYKIFNSYLDEFEDEEQSTDDILRFSNIKNSTFIWPTNVIKVKDKVVGYTTKYFKAKNLYQVNPLTINLNKICDCIKQSKKDIKIISQNGVMTFDVMYNIMYGRKFYVIDHDEYSLTDIDPTKLEAKNNNNFDYELYEFFVDNYFDKIIDSNKELKELYNGKEEDILVFLSKFKKYLSELIGKDITYLKEASKYISHNEDDYKYVRELKI